MKKRKSLSKLGKILIIVIVITGGIVAFSMYRFNKNLVFKLKGKAKITISVGSEYKDPGVTAKYKQKNLSKSVKIKGKVNKDKLGSYKITYTITHNYITKKLTRRIKVADTTAPEITLVGSDITIIEGNQYEEPGYSASDNYDGDITKKVKVEQNIDINTIGDYEIKYTVTDSNNNQKIVTRKVLVVKKPPQNQRIAVLNYHFFYDPDLGEECNESICERVSDFKQHLDYLKENNYKTLTMKEFRDWMYGELEVPEKSVLITIDDGAMGTGTHNGNKLVPLLEEYKMHATLFLITGWWPIENYQSEYLDVESHTNDMHTGGLCSAQRGAKMLCSSDDFVLNDLKKSIEITGSKTSFCFPFYAYTDHAIDLVKQAGFEIAFVGGGRKASRSDDKYRIPRYPIQKETSLDSFIRMVS